MPAPSYTEDEAAVHELGHAAVACALDLEFSHVELIVRDNPRGWGGHCVLVQTKPYPSNVVIDAFQLGGPLVQLAMIPASVGEHLNMFEPSLFTDPTSLLKDLSTLNALCWGGDLARGMLQSAPGAPFKDGWELQHGVRPWVLGLEKEIRKFAALQPVQAFVDALRESLVKTKRIESALVKQAYQLNVTPDAQAPLRAFIEPFRDEEKYDVGNLEKMRRRFSPGD